MRFYGKSPLFSASYYRVFKILTMILGFAVEYAKYYSRIFYLMVNSKKVIGCK